MVDDPNLNSFRLTSRGVDAVAKHGSPANAERFLKRDQDRVGKVVEVLALKGFTPYCNIQSDKAAKGEAGSRLREDRRKFLVQPSIACRQNI